MNSDGGYTMIELYGMEPADAFFYDTWRARVVRGLSGSPVFYGDINFIPVQDVRNGARYEARDDRLRSLTDMEVIAWAAAEWR